MKKLLNALAILFSVLTLAGAGYVLYHDGTVSAGYGVVPLVLAVACFSLARRKP